LDRIDESSLIKNGQYIAVMTSLHIAVMTSLHLPSSQCSLHTVIHISQESINYYYSTLACYVRS